MRYLILGVAINCVACSNNWKAWTDYKTLLAEPSGGFESVESTEVKDLATLEKSCLSSDKKNQNVREKPTKKSASLTTGDEFTFSEQHTVNGKSVYKKVVTKVIEVKDDKINLQNKLVDLEGFNVQKADSEVTCQLSDKGKWLCEAAKDQVKIKRSELEFEDCYAQAETKNEKHILEKGYYTLHDTDGDDITASRLTSVHEGEIFCKLADGTTRSVGEGKVTKTTYFSADIATLPTANNLCGESEFFSVKKAILKNGNEVEFLRSELSDFPIK